MPYPIQPALYLIDDDLFFREEAFGGTHLCYFTVLRNMQ